METNKKSLVVNAIIYGCILGGIYIVITLLYYIFNANLFSTGFSILSLLISIGILVVTMILGTNAYRDKSLGGKITYLPAFLSCALIGFIAFIISGVFSYIFYKFFEPNLMDQYYQKFVESMQNRNIPEEQLNMIIERVGKRFNPDSQFKTSLISAPIISIIVGLIVGLFVKKETGQGTMTM
ncbi:MAG: DUF4199 domain-containing protein [Bacteroidetes bacterium]|nr:DUF4199 domain-containing protein [Bacteroidota bacterium]